MSNIRCFLIEPTERVRRSLDVRSCNCEACQARYGYTRCPADPYNDGTHRARVELPEDVQPFDANDKTVVRVDLRDDTLPWPTRCDACGAELARDMWLRGAGGGRIYRNAETGEEYNSPNDAPPGAMFRAPWLRDFYTSQDDGAPLCVVLPNGHAWCIDSVANNCTMPDDSHQRLHHCWVRVGVPPLVTAGKSDLGPTCAAGAGSILSGNYHGFLRDGELTDA